MKCTCKNEVDDPDCPLYIEHDVMTRAFYEDQPEPYRSLEDLLRAATTNTPEIQ